MKAIYYIFALVVYSCNVFSVILPVQVIENVVIPEKSTSQMDTIVYKTVNKYFCSIGNISSFNLILYGTNSWTFPQQDVNLTLRYPTSTPDVNKESKDYRIAAFQVILYLDGAGSNGFITSGGILEDTITLSFTSSKISTLQYQFWVYGVEDDDDIQMNNVFYKMCY